MTGKSVQSPWELARRQHGVVARRQLEERGLTRHAIAHRVARGRLHPVWPGVYAVGRPELTVHGRWMGAVLTCGEGAMLSHASAAALWEIGREPAREIDVSVPEGRRPRGRGIRVHRRTGLEEIGVTTRLGIPTTTPTATLIDLAARWPARRVEAAVNEADKRNLIDPETLRTTLDAAVPRPGTRALRKILDRATYARTDSELERRFLRLAQQAGLPTPETQANLNGHTVDFHWPELRLVVETDGLRYHRTPAQQATDRRRDQTLTAAGLTVLRFTHGQVVREPERVMAVLTEVAGYASRLPTSRAWAATDSA